MKKVLILTPFMSGSGGTETVMTNFFEAYKQLDEKSFDIKLINIGGTNHEEWLKGINYQLVNLPFKNNKKLLSLEYALFLPLIMLKLLKQEKPDIVVSTNPVIWIIAKYWRKYYNSKAKIIAWYHYSLSKKPLSKRALESADYFWAISGGIKQQLKRQGISDEKISLIYNPINTNDYLVKRSQDSTITFVYVGRLMLHGQKNLKDLFDALAKVTGNWKLEVFGDGIELSLLKDYVNNLGIQDKIVWHGFNKQPWKSLKNGDALVMTSKYEGLPMVLAEAASYGMFMISSDIETGPADIIKDGENGYLYQDGNILQLATQLQQIVDGESLPSQHMIQDSVKFLELDAYILRVQVSIDRI